MLMTIILIAVGFVVTLFILLLMWGLFLYNAAENSRQAIYVKEGTVVYVMSGGELRWIHLNVEGRVVVRNRHTNRLEIKKVSDLNTDDIVQQSSWPMRFIEKRFGIYWVGWLYPLSHVEVFDILKEVLKEKSELKDGASLQDMIRSAGQPVKLNYLLYKMPRPILVLNIDTNDNFKSHMLMEIMLEMVYPEEPAFKIKNFFPAIAGAISTAVNDFSRGMSYDDLRAVPKGADSELVTKIIGVNSASTAKGLENGIAEHIGYKIVQVNIVDLELSKESKEALKALQAKKIAELESSADVTRAKNELEAAGYRAQAAAAEVTELLKAYAANPKAAETVSRQVISKNLSGLKALGGNSFLTIPEGSEKKHDDPIRGDNTSPTQTSTPTPVT